MNRLFPPPPYRRTYWLYVAHGISWTMALPLFHPAAVVPMVLAHYGATPFVIGLVVALMPLGIASPILPVTAAINHRPYRKPFMVRLATFGRATFLLPALAMLIVPEWNALVIITYAFAFGAYWVSDGGISIPYLDIIGRLLPPQWRGRMFATLQVIGGVTAVLVGIYVVPRAFAAADFDAAQATLLVLAAAILLAGVVGLHRLREPACEPGERYTVLGIVRSIPSYFRAQPQFVRLIFVHLLLMSYPMSYTFVVLGADHHLGGGGMSVTSLLGAFVVAERLGSVVAAWGWGHLNDHRGSRSAVRGTGAVMLAAMVLPLVLHLSITRDGAAAWSFSPLLLYGGVFFLVGACVEAIWISTAIFVLDLIPEAQHPVYLALRLTMYSVALFWPVLGGWIVETSGYMATYCATICTVGTGLWLTRRLIEPRKTHDVPALQTDVAAVPVPV